VNPVVVLCGGKGERLRSVLSDRPKVLAPVDGVAFLGLVLERLIREGAEEILLSTGYKADMIQEYVEARGDWGAEVRCVAEDIPLGTAGAVRHVTEPLDASRYFVLNGDTWFDGSLDELESFHAEHDAIVTLALAAVEDTARYGQVDFDDGTGELLTFNEKGRASGPGWINAGLYVLESSVLENLRDGQPASLEREIFPGLLGHGLYARPFEQATFLDIGTPEDLARAKTVLKD